MLSPWKEANIIAEQFDTWVSFHRGKTRPNKTAEFRRKATSILSLCFFRADIPTFSTRFSVHEFLCKLKQLTWSTIWKVANPHPNSTRTRYMSFLKTWVLSRHKNFNPKTSMSSVNSFATPPASGEQPSFMSGFVLANVSVFGSGRVFCSVPTFPETICAQRGITAVRQMWINSFQQTDASVALQCWSAVSWNAVDFTSPESP